MSDELANPGPERKAEAQSHPPAHNPPLTEEEAGSPFEEAKAAAMSIEVRALDGAEFEAAPDGSDAPPSTAHADVPMAAAREPGGDMVVPSSARFRKGEWEQEFSGHRLAVEIARIEAEIRRIFDERDPRRKRKLNATRRWQELEEDIVSLRFTGRVDESILREISRLTAQRHYLFNQLRYVASTRATWNT